jgi:hypothetical protein
MAKLEEMMKCPVDWDFQTGQENWDWCLMRLDWNYPDILSSGEKRHHNSRVSRDLAKKYEEEEGTQDCLAVDPVLVERFS